MAINVGEFLDELQVAIGRPGTDRDNVHRTLLRKYLNQKITQYRRIIGSSEQTITFQTTDTSGDGNPDVEYDLPDKTLRVDRVIIDGKQASKTTIDTVIKLQESTTST